MIELGSELTMICPAARSCFTTTPASPPSFSGGIGVTPVRRSFYRPPTTNYKILLRLESQVISEDAAFLDEFTDAQKKNPNFTLVATMTEIEKSAKAWRGETGFLTNAMLGKFIDDLSLPIYYISGPKAMVGAMRRFLMSQASRTARSAPSNSQAIEPLT